MQVGKPYRYPMRWPPLCRECSRLQRRGKGTKASVRLIVGMVYAYAHGVFWESIVAETAANKRL